MKICPNNVIPTNIPSSRKRIVSNNESQNFCGQNISNNKAINKEQNQGKINFLA